MDRNRMFVLVALLLHAVIVSSSALCTGIGSPCTNQSACCQTPEGTYCNLPNVLVPLLASTCNQCPPSKGGGCASDSDCCFNAFYGYKGWCRALSDTLAFCELCQPDGGLCGGPFPGFTASACCSHAFSRCNAETGFCYNATLSLAPTSAPTPPPTGVPTNVGATLVVAPIYSLVLLTGVMVTLSY